MNNLKSSNFSINHFLLKVLKIILKNKFLELSKYTLTNIILVEINLHNSILEPKE